MRISANSKIDKSKLLFLIYFYLLVFTIINKAFVPFGIDLRFVVVLLGAIQFLLNFHGTKIVLLFDRNMKLVLLLYIFIVIGMVFVSIEIPNKDIFKNLVILNLYNFFNIIVLATSQKRINIKDTISAIRFSVVVLGISIVAAIMQIPVPFNDYQSVSMTGTITSKARYCGYGTDPNYVSIIFVTYALLICAYSSKKSKKVPQILLTTFFLLFSRSLTVIAILPIMFFIYFILERAKNKKIIMIVVFMFLAVIPLVMQHFRVLGSNSSLSVRYNMWSRALKGFIDHPIIGNGLGAARFRSFYTNNWLVQCHSTYFQLLCEHGIIALLLYFNIFFNNIISTKNNLKSISYLLYFVWSFTYETLYLPFTILYFAIFPYCLSDRMEGRD